MNHRIIIGSHVGMSGKDMFLGSVKEAITYGSNTFMIYTGAPQNTKRKKNKLDFDVVCGVGEGALGFVISL